MKTLLSFYNFKLPFYFVYMLQQVEYDPNKFLDWLQRLVKQNKNINSVMHRKSLVMTQKSKALILYCYLVAVLIITIDVIFFYEFYDLLIIILLVSFIAVPYFVILGLYIVTFLAHKLIVKPSQKKLIKESKRIFSNSKAVKIAVIGSYGKTTMKELLYTILDTEKNVAITPGNMNTSVSHARFASRLSGKEDIIIVEFGEGEPGDVRRMSDTVLPDYAIITGLSPNHLDYYPSLKAVADDLLSVYKFTDKNNIYVTKESELLQKYTKKEMNQFSSSSVMGWKITNILISVTQTSFVMKKGKKELKIKTGLLGRHQIAPVALGAALADKLGLSKKHIEVGCAKIIPYEHRMQARHMHGAWLIDDTYNGNIEGLIAGLKLLAELDMKRKWYVTPGLVDQGVESVNVHKELGKNIAKYNPDIVVLMENSARPIIEDSMKKAGYKGELRIEENPLEFYTNLEQVVAAGDLMLLQNDWTDNYE